MNVINVKVSFEQGICSKTGISLVSGDYNSTKMQFEFDVEEGTKILEISDSNNETIYLGEIINNEVTLVAIRDGEVYSLFPEAGDYKYEISLYEGDSKLTSAYDYFTVKAGRMAIDDKTVEPYLPVFDELMSDISEAINETNTLDIDAEKVDSTTTVTITKKDGTQKEVEILDGEKGEKGDTGATGQAGEDGKDAKINGVNTLNIVAGENIEIEQSGDTLTINSIGGGTTYTAGENIQISDENVISATDTIYDDTEIKGNISNLQTNKADKTEIPDVSNFITKNVNDLTYYTLATSTGSTIELSINSSTYVMTLNLKNSAGTTISTGTVDLPLESVVVSGSYDDTTKKIILTLQSGSTVEFSVADLVSGLQSEITSSNKLSSDLVDDTNNTNKFVSANDITNWNGKYSKPSGGIPDTDLSSAVQTSLGKADTALQTETYTGTITSVKMNGTTISSSGEADLGTVITSHQDISGKQDIIQYSTMPTASAETIGKIIQYIGTTSNNYTNGYFYIGTSTTENNETTYSWTALNVQSSQDISGKEDKSNKVTSMSSSSTDTEYPSAKAVYDALQNAGGSGGITYLGYVGDYYSGSNPLDFTNIKKGIYFLYGSQGSNQMPATMSVKAITASGNRSSTWSFAKRGYPTTNIILLNITTDYPEPSTISGNSFISLGTYSYTTQSASTGSLDFVTGGISVNKYGLNFSSALISSVYVYANGGDQTISGVKTFSTLPESSVTPTTDNQLTRKGYVDSLPTTYSGYDATKTQILKNVNGTLTWIDE